jgi:hypothetical protein
LLLQHARTLVCSVPCFAGRNLTLTAICICCAPAAK